MKIFDFMPSPAAQPLLLLTSAKSLRNSFMIHKNLFARNKHLDCCVHYLRKPYFKQVP